MNVTEKIPALRDIAIPAHVVIDVKTDYESLLREIGRRSVGFDGIPLFGCAFIQGGRLQFTTAMPIKKMLDISEQDRASKGANVKDVLDHSNRPREASHEKNIKKYLEQTACIGEKFILPSFTFNFGAKVQDDTPDITLILLDAGHDGSQTWPAALLLPQAAKLDTTDGAHRRNTIKDMEKKLDQQDPEARARLLANAVDVKLVFESSLRDSHQDFADCGRAKPIAKSQLSAYDARDTRNQIATDLALTHPFLMEYVDGSANNVNLSAKSHRVWSLSALRTMVGHILDHYPDKEVHDTVRMTNVRPFLDELIKHLPQLKVLEAHRQEKHRNPQLESITGKLREMSGGDVALRGIGLVMFGRGYLFSIEYRIPFADMARSLAKLDWHVLDCERDLITVAAEPDVYHNAIIEHVNPIWRPALVIKSRRYKISSSLADANACWDLIVDKVLVGSQSQAAE